MLEMRIKARFPTSDVSARSYASLHTAVFTEIFLNRICHLCGLVALSICFCKLCCTLVNGLKVESSFLEFMPVRNSEVCTVPWLSDEGDLAVAPERNSPGPRQVRPSTCICTHDCPILPAFRFCSAGRELLASSSVLVLPQAGMHSLPVSHLLRCMGTSQQEFCC